MAMLTAQAFRVQPIAVGWQPGVISRGFNIVWIGHVISIIPPPPPPVPPRRPRRGGGGGAPWILWPPVPLLPEICEDSSDQSLIYEDDQPDLPTQLAYRLAERISQFPNADVSIRLAWRMRKPKR